MGETPQSSSTDASSASAPAPRERFATRLGFIMLSAACAIGLGNVWRFPYITGEYGGAAFVLVYLVFLVVLGLPVMVMEFAVGRASQASPALAYDRLRPDGKWHWFSWWGFIGCTVLMMFYTVVCGWMLAYIFKMGSGELNGLDAAGMSEAFQAFQADPVQQIGWMLVVVVFGVLIVGRGLQAGVERVTKVMMVCLLAVLVVLVIRSVTLPGAEAGLSFYLLPDFSKLTPEAVFAAMGQAFFTLSVGMSSMEVFGSYIGKDRSLTGEAGRIVALDTFVAIMAGLIIFPACFSFGVDPGQGPSLVFVTLPSVFDQMPAGQLWGALFFVFMSFAALSTIIAVFENLTCFIMDRWGWRRKKAVRLVFVMMAVLSLPAAMSANLLGWVNIPGIGDIQSLEDFIVSSNMLPLGGLLYAIFCTTRFGWGWDNFIAGADAGKGLKFPAWARGWVTFGVPILIALVWISGYVM
jgi:NSS family neurotransmitter:Na+ symporter